MVWNRCLLLNMAIFGIYLKFLASWWFQPHWKILVKLDHFPTRGENKKCLKPPPSWGVTFPSLINIQKKHISLLHDVGAILVIQLALKCSWLTNHGWPNFCLKDPPLLGICLLGAWNKKIKKYSPKLVVNFMVMIYPWVDFVENKNHHIPKAPVTVTARIITCLGSGIPT